MVAPSAPAPQPIRRRRVTLPLCQNSCDPSCSPHVSAIVGPSLSDFASRRFLLSAEKLAYPLKLPRGPIRTGDAVGWVGRKRNPSTSCAKRRGHDGFRQGLNPSYEACARIFCGAASLNFGATSVANSSSEASAFSTPYHGG